MEFLFLLLQSDLLNVRDFGNPNKFRCYSTVYTEIGHNGLYLVRVTNTSSLSSCSVALHSAVSMSFTLLSVIGMTTSAADPFILSFRQNS